MKTIKVLLDCYLYDEFEEYLQSIEEIKEFNALETKRGLELIVKCDNNMNLDILIKHINLFLDDNSNKVLEYELETNGDVKTIKYLVDDMCCEYCYKNFIDELINNKDIISVKSNADLDKPLYNIEFIISYKSNISDIDLLEYLKKIY